MTDVRDTPRASAALLDVLIALLDTDDQELDGWEIIKAARRSGPTVYQVLEDLSRAELVQSRWEDIPPSPERARRRYYRLTPNGVAYASRVVANKRSRALRTLRLAMGGQF
ncbi:helix-turn-helix transcriptional regulator [Catellatospora sp. NPDC049609]|uniref:PadR family transcriptional regulator n=1 Tax=Catellatospora sp. NPDC049609 TaxID=3155505 RepID=UPI0034493AE7